MKRLLLILVFSFVSIAVHGSQIKGRVIDKLFKTGVPQARITFFLPNLALFRETRSDTNGYFSFSRLADGTYRVGIAALNYDYQEVSLSIASGDAALDFQLQAESNPGRWTIVGNTEPELLGGSGSGSLLPTGEVFFCHDTEEPIVFDPVAKLKWFPPSSGTEQGCHITTLNTDGGLFFAGGSMGGNPLDPVVKIAKAFHRGTNGWDRLPDMNTGRWYPGMVRLPDERLLVMGGERDDPGYGRTNGCEIFDPKTKTWTITGSFDLPTEIAPSVVLNTGEVLKTWRYPELYNVQSGKWRPAPTMQQPRAGAAGGDHCDHEIVHLPDGRVMAVGINPLQTNANTRFCEFYSPADNTWSLGPNPRALRGRPEALVLPDGRVLAFGGQYSGIIPSPVPLANAGTIPNCTKVSDLYDPARNSWRALSDLNRFIHYHNVTVLVPDGRVIATGGAGLTSNRSFAGDDSSIEAFEPPYLFRGIRPRINSLSTTDFVLGKSAGADVSFASNLTGMVLVSARATTHWVDGGPQRFVSLAFVQNGASVEVQIPSDPIKLLPGYYILFAMVDDIPSNGVIARVLSVAKPSPEQPIVSMSPMDFSISETSTGATLSATRSGPTNSPLTISYIVGGSAINGEDYDTLSGSLTFPTGARSTDLRISPRNDTLSEGAETVSVVLSSSSGYRIGNSSNAVVTVTDDEIAPPPLSMSIHLFDMTRFRFSLQGSASRMIQIQSSSDLKIWEPFATVFNSTGVLNMVEPLDTLQRFFKAVEVANSAQPF